MQRLTEPNLLGASLAGTPENAWCIFSRAADKRMNEADLNAFNNGLQAIVNTFDERCAAMNVRRVGQPWHARHLWGASCCSMPSLVGLPLDCAG